MFFISKIYLGIDIHQSKINLVAGYKKKKELIIKSFCSYTLSYDFSVDEIKNRIKEFTVENKIKNFKTNILIRDTTVLVKDIRLQSRNEKEISNILRYDLEKYFSNHEEKYISGFEMLVSNTGVENECLCLVAVVPELLINQYIKMFTDMKKEISLVDIFHRCVFRAFNDLVEADHDFCNIIFYFQNNVIRIIVINEGQLFYGTDMDMKDNRELDYYEEIYASLMYTVFFNDITKSKQKRIYFLGDICKDESLADKFINIGIDVCQGFSFQNISMEKEFDNDFLATLGLIYF